MEYVYSLGVYLATTSVNDHCVSFEVLVALGAKIMVFLDVLLLSLVAQDEGCVGTCSFQLPFTKMMVCAKSHSIAAYRVFLITSSV